MTLWAYICADLGLIPLRMPHLPTLRRTCFSSQLRLTISLGSPCAPSIYDVATMYTSSSLRREVFAPLLFLTTVLTINVLTILFVNVLTPMRPHRCFREEYFSGGNIKFREHHIVEFGTQNSSRSPE